MEGKEFDEKFRILRPDVLARCIYGGRGEVNLVAPSGKSHTYKFVKPDGNDFPVSAVFVYAIHNERKFYVGMIESGKFRRTRHSWFLPDTEIVKGAAYIASKISPDVHLSHLPMKFYHNGLCAKCGRPLSSEKQLSEGMGRHCLRKFVLGCW